MLRVLAVDDELPALEELSFLLREDPRIGRVSGAREAAEALRDLSRMLVAGERLDAVFLDIRMPGLDGLDFTRLLTGFADPPHVVFVTAHDDCAVAAYELGALDYLLKPVRRERLAEAVRRVDEAVHRPAHGADGAAPDRPPEDETIPVELGGRTRLVSRRAVSHVEAQGDYVRLHTAEGSYLVRMPLAALARRWEEAGFIRIHRSTLVASAHITELRFDGGRAAVQIGDELLPVSRRHTREVRDLLVRRFRHNDPAGEEDAAASGDGTVQPGAAAQPDAMRPGAGQPGVERPGVERQGVERQGVERQGVERPGVERQGIERRRVERQGAGQSGVAQYGAGQHGAGQYGAGQHGAGQHGTGQYGAGQHRRPRGEGERDGGSAGERGGGADGARGSGRPGE